MSKIIPYNKSVRKTEKCQSLAINFNQERKQGDAIEEASGFPKDYF